MDNRNSRGAAVDDILDEIRGGQRTAKKIDSAALDDILAELGHAPAKKPAARQAAAPAQRQAQPAPQPKAPARSAQPAPERAEKPTAPAPQPKAAPKPAAPKKKDFGETSIFDIELQRTGPMERVGKAAAIDKVDHDKYKGDTELLSWFSDSAEEPALSKREQRRLEKERRRQEAADRKLDKKRGRAEPEETITVSSEKPDFSMFAHTGETQEIRLPGSKKTEPKPQAAPMAPKAPKPEEDSFALFGEAARQDGWVSASELFEDAKIEKKPRLQVPEPQQPSAAAPVPQPPKAASAQTAVFTAVQPGAKVASAPQPAQEKEHDTQTFEPVADEAEPERVPTAAFTQEFETDEPKTAAPQQRHAATAELTEKEGKSLYLDDMVDDRFRAFFGETVIVDKDELEQTQRTKKQRARTKTRTSRLFTGEFAQLAMQADEELAALEEDENEYNRPQDAETVEKGIEKLKSQLVVRSAITAVLALLLFWLGVGYGNNALLPGFISPAEHAMGYGLTYVILIVATIGVNFQTVAAGLVGLFSDPTVDSAVSLASVASLLQGVVLTVQLLTSETVAVTLFGGLAAALLVTNALGKQVRAAAIGANFQLASAGIDHSAAYTVGSERELAHDITTGLSEENPVLLVSRPTTLVRGFMRQSFSLRWTDAMGRIQALVLLGTGLLAAVVSFIMTGELLVALSAIAATLCIGAPLSSTLVQALPTLFMQRATSKVGAVVPGWSAIEELGKVNVVMANARDIFPPSSVTLRGIKTFEKERTVTAILYAASVLIEGCDTLRDIFSGVIQGKSDMLYKVESLTKEPGRGFTAWVENQRVVIGTREMLQKHDIAPPPIEVEMKHTADGSMPVYLAVAGTLYAMFVIRYTPDEEVSQTLEGLVNSGVSLLVTSDDMNLTGEFIEKTYGLPAGVVKVLGRRELDILEPLTAYLPESDGVMTHIGSFTSFIGGMSAAAGCAASERLSGWVQVAAVVLAAVLCLLLMVGGGLASLSLTIALLYQLGWTLLVCVLPLWRR